MNGYTLGEILSKFNITDPVLPYGDGHINDTYVTNTEKRYVLQRINTHVFAHPEQVMENIARVTAHLREKIIASGGDPARETLTLIKTVDGQNFYRTASGDCFRMYLFIEGAKTYQTIENPMHFYHGAKAFGRFQKLLADFPAHLLYETIPKFHDTRDRFSQLELAANADRMGRKKDVLRELRFIDARKADTGVIVDAISDGSVPVRVTHNDTKFNNVMIDETTGEGVCVIDLDTVMCGSLLYDYGDSLRFGATPAAEDEKDLSKVYCDLNLFEHFTRGYLEELRGVLTPREIELLPFSAKLMTLECGMRFLTDYLNGDTYFKIHYPGQNLDRARTQLALVADMEKKAGEMAQIVAKYFK